MRIASTQYESILNRSLTLNQEKISHISQQLATGNKIELPSDDPIANVRLSRLNREEAILTQYRDNIGAVKIGLQKNETYLSSMVTDMQEGRDLLVWASDGGNASADLGAMVNSMTALRDSLFYSANVKDQEGRSVFAGTLSNSPALSYNALAPLGARYSYTGNNGQQMVTVGNGITQAANVDVDGLQTLLNQMDSTIATLGTPGVNVNDPLVRTVLGANLDGMDAAMGLVSTKIAIFGGAQNILATLDGNHGNVSLSNKMAIHDIGDLDYSIAATSLNGYSSALQATYKAYTKVSGLSLFDAL
jgi:flagellar hook-associated protein 3 FlgL